MQRCNCILKKIRQYNGEKNKNVEQYKMLKLLLENRRMLCYSNIKKVQAKIVGYDHLIENMHKETQEIIALKNNIHTISLNITKITLSENIKEQYSNLMSVNGVVNCNMLDAKFAELSVVINNILKRFVPFRVYFEIKMQRLMIMITNGDNLVSVQHLSGFERFILDLAIKLSIGDCVDRNRSNLFAIDEGLDVVDEHNWGRMNEILDLVTDRYGILFLITHREGIDKYYTRKITIANGCVEMDENC
jgi:DNA repair exonuclease SbcCD ATPase subunit